jgi:hypothetical protein
VEEMIKSGIYSINLTRRLERTILKYVGWNTRGLITYWIDWSTRNERDNKALHVLITYLVTSALCNVDVCGVKPDLLVASCDMLAREMLGIGSDENEELVWVGQEVIKGLVRGRGDYTGVWERYSDAGGGASCYVDNFLKGFGI